MGNGYRGEVACSLAEYIIEGFVLVLAGIVIVTEI